MLVVAAAQALAPAIRHRSRPLMMANSDFGTFGQFGRVDLFDEPPTVGGVVVTAPATLFPKQLEQPAELAKKATITPFPDWASIVFAPSETGDLIAAVFVGTALLLGPDFLLAPAGIVSDDGIRPGFALERVVGELIDGDAQWHRGEADLRLYATSAGGGIAALGAAPKVSAAMEHENKLMAKLVHKQQAEIENMLLYEIKSAQMAEEKDAKVAKQKAQDDALRKAKERRARHTFASHANLMSRLEVHLARDVDFIKTMMDETVTVRDLFGSEAEDEK